MTLHGGLKEKAEIKNLQKWVTLFMDGSSGSMHVHYFGILIVHSYFIEFGKMNF